MACVSEYHLQFSCWISCNGVSWNLQPLGRVGLLALVATLIFFNTSAVISPVTRTNGKQLGDMSSSGIVKLLLNRKLCRVSGGTISQHRSFLALCSGKVRFPWLLLMLGSCWTSPVILHVQAYSSLSEGRQTLSSESADFSWCPLISGRMAVLQAPVLATYQSFKYFVGHSLPLS